MQNGLQIHPSYGTIDISAVSQDAPCVLKYLTKETGATEQTVNLVYGGTAYTTLEVAIGETLGSIYEHIRLYENDGTTLLVDLTDYVVTDTKATYGSCIPGNNI